MTGSLAARSLAITAASACAVLLAACGTSLNGPLAGQSSPPSAATQPATPATSAAPATTSPSTPAPSPSATAGASTAAACSSDNLTVTVVTSLAGGAAGSTYVPIQFANTSRSPCTLYGYPGVSFVTSPTGSQIGAAASRNPTVQPSTVTLQPGGDAHAFLQVADAGNYSPSVCKPVTATWLRVYPPGSYTALYTTFTSQVCSGDVSKFGDPLGVYAVQAGAARSGAGP